MTEGHPSPFRFSARRVGDRYIVVCNDLPALGWVAGALLSTTVESGAMSLMQSVKGSDVWGHRRYRHDDSDATASGRYVVAPDSERLLVRLRPVSDRPS